MLLTVKKLIASTQSFVAAKVPFCDSTRAQHRQGCNLPRGLLKWAERHG